MRKHHPRDKRFEEIDEHDQPTEPMAQVVLSPFPSTTPLSGWQSEVAPPFERSFPQQPAYPSPLRDPFSQQPANPVYPVLHPSQAGNWNGQSFGESLPALPPSSAQSRLARPQPHRSLFPSLVGAFFVIVQLLLLVDFLLELFGQLRTTSWGHIIYLIGNIFVQPFLLLLKNVTFPITMSKEFYTSLVILIAILIYGVLSRILVRFFKALLHSR